jgi:hypothetical protein
MATRDSYAQDPSSGDILTAANFRKLPGGWIGYNEGTTDQNTVTTAVDVTGCSVTLTPDNNRRLLITGQIFVEANAAAARAQIAILADGAQVGPAAHIRMETSGSAGRCSVRTSAIITPTNASHTYKLQAAGVTGTINVLSSAQTAFILVEDIGPAS